jgi:hypothetical protein
MKIKHWKGHGYVNAVRISDTNKQVIIRVSGNHECGVQLHGKDNRCLSEWLGKLGKFVLSQIDSYKTNYNFDKVSKEDVCMYYIKFKEGNRVGGIYEDL